MTGLLGVDRILHLWNVQSLDIFSSLCVCLHFLGFCCHQGTWIYLKKKKQKKGIFIYLACGPWCKQTVITSVSTGSCYITVIICDVMVCVCVCVSESVSVCEEFITVSAWTAAMRISRKTVKKVKSDSLPLQTSSAWNSLPHPPPSSPTFPALHRGGPRCHGDLIAQFSPFPLDPLFDEILPILACLCTDVL